MLRNINIEQLKGRTHDCLIIGCGINGAIAAAALAGQGCKVSVVDRGDFGNFTSQESSNLIWGGIKYMESFEFGLVRKLCLSRNELMEAFPANISEIRFFTSLAPDFRFPNWIMGSATWLYWLIGNGFTKPPRILTKSIIGREQPEIDVSKFTGGIEYSDAYLVDNDARFVFQFVRTAMDYGAIAANYVSVERLIRIESGLWQVSMRDLTTNQNFNVRARSIINAAGPFVDSLNQTAGISTRHRHVFSKGIHLIVPAVTKARKVLTFFADDGRLFFVIPMGPRSVIGTTDTRVDAPITQVTNEDIEFVLSNINKRLHLECPLTAADVITTRCGVRPLVVESNLKDTKSDWTKLSRKHVIEDNTQARYASIFGGKLTDCLNVGREVIKICQSWQLLDQRKASMQRWYGEPDPSVASEFFRQARKCRLDALTAPESSEPLSRRLWRRYGLRAFSLLDEIRADHKQAEVLIKGTEYIRCELFHAARCEMVTHLGDFLRRRSKIALIARPETIRHAEGLKEACEILFKDQAESEIERYFSGN